MVELRDDDLIALGPLARGGPGQREREGRHVRAEDRLLGTAAEEIGRGEAGLGHERLGAAARLIGATDVRVGFTVVARDGVDDRVGHLGAARSVEEGERLSERREAGPNRLHVECDGRHRRRRYYDCCMAPATKERIDRGTGTGLGAPWNVIVLNDNHNTFQGVATALASTLPEVSYDQGLRIADRIHSSGRAIVWSGHKEIAEHYWQQLQDHGLTMSPLERT